MNKYLGLLICLIVSCFFVDRAPCSDVPPGMVLAQSPAPVPVAREDAPGALILEKAHDFGKITTRGEYEHTFKVENTGTTVLEIRRVLPG